MYSDACKKCKCNQPKVRREKDSVKDRPCPARLPRNSCPPRCSRTHTRPSARRWGPCTTRSVRRTRRRPKGQGIASGQTRAARGARRGVGDTRGLRPCLQTPRRVAWCTPVPSRCRRRRRARRRWRGARRVGGQRLPIWKWNGERCAQRRDMMHVGTGGL